MLFLSLILLRHCAENRSSWILGASMQFTQAVKKFSAPLQD